MKRLICLALCLLAVFAVGCQNGKKVHQSIIYADWVVYETAEELAEKADNIFEGKITSISFAMVDLNTGRTLKSEEPGTQPMLHTIYTVEVTRSLKGKNDDVTSFCIIGGIPGKYEKEQYSTLSSFYGRSEELNLPILDKRKELAVGESYLFLTCRLGGDYDQIVNIEQFAFSADNETPEFGICYSDIVQSSEKYQ